MANNKEYLEKQAKYPSKTFLVTLLVTYLICNLSTLIIVLVSFPILRDTTNWGKLVFIQEFIDEYYVLFLIIATLIQFIDTTITYSLFLKHKFPTFMSVAAMLYNDVICTIFAIVIYVIDMRNIYFSFQIVLLIPVITIFLSSIFLIDDYNEYFSGKFASGKKAPKKKDVVPISNLNAQNLTNSPAVQEEIIENAAKMQIPSLQKDEEENDDAKEEPEEHKE